MNIRQHFSLRTMLPLAMGVLSLSGTLICWQMFRTHDDQKFNQATLAEAVSLQKQITLDLESRIGSLERMGSRLSWDPKMSQFAWQSGASLYRKYFPDVLKVVMLTADQKKLWVNTDQVRQKPLNAAQEKEKRRVLNLAAKTHKSIISPIVELSFGGQGFFIAVPIFYHGRLYRFATAGLRSQQFFSKFAPSGYEFSIRQNNAPTYTTISQDKKFDAKWGQATSFTLHAANWTIHVLPTPQLVRDSQTALPKATLILGIIISLLLTSLVDLLMRVWEKERRELQRSRELENANQIAVAATKAKSEFLANMSHEIRTPINSIIGLTKIFSESNLDEEQKNIVSGISNSSEALLALINDILDISKVENGKIEIEKVPFRLSRLLLEAKETFESLAVAKGLKFHLFSDFDHELSVLGDPRRIRQVLMNLLSNSLKFTAQGEIKLVAKAFSQGSNILIEFVVSDTGIGISPENLGKLFQKFNQADASISRNYGGTGLGLFISKRLTELMGGKIQASSYEGVGSKFSFTVIAEKITETEEALDDKKSSRRKKILIADDVEDVRFLLERYLNPLEHELTFVENGEEALEEFKKSEFDFIFMDMQMPVMDGATAVKKIREHELESGRRSVPIVALTSYSGREDIDRVLKAGCDQFLFKPVIKDQLVRMLQTAESNMWQ